MGKPRRRLMLLGTTDPLTTWQHAERYLGGGTRTYSPFAADLQISGDYHPQYGADSFTVPTFWVDAGGWLANTVDSDLLAYYRCSDQMLLPVHPETLTVADLPFGALLRKARPGPLLQVVPSANARTVFVTQIDQVPVTPHFVKLHYPRRLSRFTRRLRRPVIELHLWVAEQLHRIGAPGLPEVAGGVIGDDPQQAWGFLLREAQVPTVAPLTYTVPLLALYGYDVRSPADPTLLEQLVTRSGEDASTWLTTRLINPMITLWCDVLLRTGCALELHGQNTLLLASSDGRHTQVAVRDFAVYIDPAIRAQRGLAGLPARNVISHDIEKPREQVLSLVYDTFMAGHTLSYLARLAEDRFGTCPAVLQRYARQVFAAQMGSNDLLPATTYNYDATLHPDGGWQLVDTGVVPVWR